MPQRPCLDCGNPTSATRCDECRRDRDRQRDRRRNQQRGEDHGTRHATERRRLTPFVTTGTATCSRCHQPIAPGDPWDADQRPWGFEPSHSRCNRAAGARGEP